MRSDKEIKADLLKALEHHADDALNALGFKRRRGSLDYIRKVDDSIQKIVFAVDYNPKYEAGADVHLHPNMHLSMPLVSDFTLRLADGNKMLLANAPDLIVNQPIDFVMPKEERSRFFATGLEEMKRQVAQLIELIKQWSIPFFDELTTVQRLVEFYEREDERMMKQRHWYLFIAGANLALGQEKAALEVLEKNYKNSGLKSRYASAFAYLNA